MYQRKNARVSWWPSQLRMWHCHCCGMGAFLCSGHSQKQKTKTKKSHNHPPHPQKKREGKNQVSGSSIKWTMKGQVRRWVFGIFFIFIHMTRFYTKNSQLNSTNLHSWGMLKKIQLKNPLLPVTHNPNILQCRGEGGWGGREHPKQVSPKRNDLNFTFPLHTGSKWWEYNLQFIFFSCRCLWCFLFFLICPRIHFFVVVLLCVFCGVLCCFFRFFFGFLFHLCIGVNV